MFLAGGILVAVVGIVIWLRVTRQKAAPVDPIESTTGSNRVLTGTQPKGAVASLSWDEALRRLVAYALDDYTIRQDSDRVSSGAKAIPAIATSLGELQQALRRKQRR